MKKFNGPVYPIPPSFDENENLEKGIDIIKCKKCFLYHEINERFYYCSDCKICIEGNFKNFKFIIFRI